MSIKITVTNELDIDLNSYYRQFPTSLQAAINKAIGELAGGAAKPGKKTNLHNLGWGDGNRLTSDLRKAKLGREPQRHGAQLRAFRVLARDFGDKEFTMGDAKKSLLIDGATEKGKITTLIANMWANEVLIVSQLN